MTARVELTKNQLKVLEKLEAATGPLSAYTLLDQLREQGFRAPLQVYRALDTLIRDGYAHSLESLNAFVACSDAHDHGHGHPHRMTAFAICDQCGQVAEFSDDAGRRTPRRLGRLDRLRHQEGRSRVPRHLREMRGEGGLIPVRQVFPQGTRAGPFAGAAALSAPRPSCRRRARRP